MKSSQIAILVLCSFGQAAKAQWRSEMFPPNWVPLDAEIIDGVNRFYDDRGTRDYYGRPVSEGHPDYHPYRFLHDFSYAGYRRGEVRLPPEDPDRPALPVFDVTKPPYSCVPDGASSHNCTLGIQKAIDDASAAGGGIVYLPAGEYRIRSSNPSYFLRIARSRVVIQGDGPDRTRILVDPHQGGTFSMHRKSVFLVSGGNLWQDDIRRSARRAAIVDDLLFPTRVIPVASVDPFEDNGPNAEVAIVGYRTGAFLAEHDMAGTWTEGRPGYLFRRTIVSIDRAAKTITIDVPTRYRIRRTDSPEVVVVPPGISEVGLENFAIGMIRHPDAWYYTGSIETARDTKNPPIIYDLWQTRAITLTNVNNGWIYRVHSYRPAQNAGRYAENRLTGKPYGNYEIEILNEAFLLQQSRHITVKDCVFRNAQVDTGSANGYAVRISGSDNLLQNVVIEKTKKGFSLMDPWCHGNVISDCITKDPLSNADLFHWQLSMANLVENHALDGGYWTAVVQGIDQVGQGHSSSESVFWNIRGLRAPIIDRKVVLDRDNDEDGIPDPLEKHGDLPDVALVISVQYGWGYVIGTYGAFSDVLTPSVQRSISGDWSRPRMYPRDYREGIGYDPAHVGSLEPRSLYAAQLEKRLGRSPPPSKPRPPTASIVSISPNPVVEGEPATFRGLGRDPDSAIVAYEWTSSLDGLLSQEAEFTTSSLSLGVHTIQLRVQDDSGLWCETPAQKTLEVIPAPSAVELILDNGQPGTSSAGSWAISGGANPYGANSLYSKTAGAWYRYQFAVASPGTYVVSLWWTEYPSRPSSVPVDIQHASGSATVYIDQHTNGGKWNAVGAWNFSGSAVITIRSLGNGSTCADAVKLTPCGTHQSSPIQVILDNAQAGTSSAGTWIVSGGASPYGANSLYSRAAGAWYRYTLPVPSPGSYRVSLWWTEYPGRSSSVPVDIQHASGTATVTVDQRTNGGRWNALGTWRFSGSAVITIRSLGNGSTCADAVKIESVDS